MSIRRLAGRRKKFVLAYLGPACGNAQRAAEMAGYSPSTGNAYRLFRHPEVRETIEAALARAAMGANEVLARLTAIARLDADDFVSVDPVTGDHRIDLEKAKERGVLQYADSISITDQGVRVKFPSKLEALHTLAKYHGLLVERVSVETAGDSEAIRAEILEKLRAAIPHLPADDRAKLEGPKGSDGASGSITPHACDHGN